MSDDESFEVTAEEKYLSVAIMAVFSVFGSAGNAVVLYVFSTAKDNLVSTLFIIVLAAVDFITCLVIIPFTIVVELLSYNVRFDLLCKLYQFLITSNIPFSALIMTAIAVDRYFCICHPFARLLTLGRARVVVLVLAAFAGLLGVIGALTHGVYQRAPVVSNATNRSTVMQLTTTPPEVPGGEAVYTGFCEPTELILNSRFMSVFQGCYTAIFAVCLGIVAVLYFLIYRSVLRQRHKRQKMKATPSRSHVQRTAQKPSTVVVDLAEHGNSGSAASAGPRRDNDGEAKVCIEASQQAMEIVSHTPATDAVLVCQRPISEKRSEAELVNSTATEASSETLRRNRIANIKTAAMLFVVTLVFTVSFFPSLAMTLFILPYNMTIFYVYFANNVANPVIYSFMNVNFRKRLALLFCK